MVISNGQSVRPNAVVGTGGLMQVYLTPRYFIEGDTRVDFVDDRAVPVFGLGMGFHIGR